MPLRWQCPQAITTRVYTAKSDVYSFGVLLYEIYSGGGKPFADLMTAEVIKAVLAGARLSRPRADTPEDVIQLMRQCTVVDTRQRPSMMSVEAELRQDGRSVGVAQGGAGAASQLTSLQEETQL